MREIKEEIGIDLKVDDISVVHVMQRKGSVDERIDFFMTTRAYSGEISNNEPDKCDDLSWFKLDQLPENIVEYVKVALLNYRNGDRYSEFGY